MNPYPGEIDWTTRNQPMGVPAMPVSPAVGYMPGAMPPAPPTSKKYRAGLVVAAVAAAALLIGAGIGLIAHTGHTAARPAPSATHTGPAAAALAPNIQRACDLNQQMRDGQATADLRGQGATIDQIKALAGSSEIFDIRFEANMLKDDYDLANAARGGDLAFSTTVSLFTTSIRLSTACVNAGWKAKTG